jgi:hypothetical protein
MTDNQPVALAEGETAAEPDAPLVPGAEPDLAEEDESGHDVHDTIAAACPRSTPTRRPRPPGSRPGRPPTMTGRPGSGIPPGCGCGCTAP